MIADVSPSHPRRLPSVTANVPPLMLAVVQYCSRAHNLQLLAQKFRQSHALKDHADNLLCLCGRSMRY